MTIRGAIFLLKRFENVLESGRFYANAGVNHRKGDGIPMIERSSL
jgi:hypothetical protein